MPGHLDIKNRALCPRNKVKNRATLKAETLAGRNFGGQKFWRAETLAGMKKRQIFGENFGVWSS